ncbi:MAG: ABC transporter ATP-binding protein [Thermoprotei archaeon]|nr:MAG: ABC transporter ATP-binding protein [Thermoprotei archaeon]RLF25287.1 MAG: ABC transporter ATP-binding protein [Thermoprotei archaeon]
MKPLLEVKDLYVEASGQVILQGINLGINEHEVHVLMGPNGAGKSTLLRVIMGDPRYKIVRGTIKFKGKTIDSLKPYERARMGIAMAYQTPPKVSVKLSYLLNKLGNPGSDDHLIELLNLKHLLDRNLHYGFSGGEAKRAELLLTIKQRPELALLDEPDSGVDVDSLAVIGKAINELIEKGASILLVTHMGHILKYLKRVDVLHVIVGGRMAYSGDPEFIDEILSKGYEALFNKVV